MYITSILGSANDGEIFIWDSRCPMGATQRISSSVGQVSQVCWERLRGRTLASSHFGTICTWDVRRADLPVQTVENAHEGPILALDFSIVRPGELVSSDNMNKVMIGGGGERYGIYV